MLRIKMIQVKILGSVMLVFAALLWAFWRYSAEKRRLCFLRFFTGLAIEIKRQIEMLDMPIEKIIENADMCSIDPLFKSRPEKVDIQFLSELASRELDGEDSEKVREFFSGLGRHFRDEEIKRCSYFSEMFSSSLVKKEVEYGAKCRMYFTVSLCTALGFIILII